MEVLDLDTLNSRLFDAIAEVTESLTDAPGVFAYDAEPEFIETKARDGFIPFTDGGAHVCVGAVASYCASSGSYPCAAVEEMCDRMRRDAQEAWESETGKSLDSVLDNRDSDDPETRKQAESDWDEFGEYEHEWMMEGAEFYYKARAIYYEKGNYHSPDKTQDCVLFDVYVCLDSYGRDSIPWVKVYGASPDQTSGEYSRVVPVSELTDERLAAIVQEMKSQY